MTLAPTMMSQLMHLKVSTLQQRVKGKGTMLSGVEVMERMRKLRFSHRFPSVESKGWSLKVMMTVTKSPHASLYNYYFVIILFFQR